MTQRTQVTLDPELHRHARRKAAELGISLAEYVRRLVREDLDVPRSRGDTSQIIGLGDSGGSDIGAHKDTYVANALAMLRPR